MLGHNILKKVLNLPLRTKFILSFFLVISCGGIIILILGTRLEHRTIFSLAQAKVRHDLEAARMVFNEKLKDIHDIVELNTTHEGLQAALRDGNTNRLLPYLDLLRVEFNLDVLTLTDSRGKVVMRTRRPDNLGDDLSKDLLVSRALKGEIASSPQIVSREELMQEGEDLAQQAYLDLLPTPKAAPRLELHEENGMMLKAAAPVYDENRQILGVIYAGILLNRNYEIVDRVKEIVFKGEKYKGREIGTATIFQNDLRISTNVQRATGDRAIGTRVSKEVSQAVLQEGQSWLDRAFVVNDWYISAYEPIKNIEGTIIGILYVGMLEKPYVDLRNTVMTKFSFMAVICLVVLFVIIFFIISGITKPLHSMVFATNRIAQGNLNHRVTVSYHDEIGQLADSFNRMTADLKKANEKLIIWGKTLEKRVEERTLELRDTQDSLIQSEKMASLGKMAAGVAHEINNPLTSILINTHLMLEQTREDSPFHENLRLIADETARCSTIVKGLLEFSRQQPPQKDPSDINELLRRTVKLLENQVAFQNIQIEREFHSDLPPVCIDKGQIKQVIWNLMINAAEAMPNGGTLRIASRFIPQKNQVELVFSDSGIGIPKENLNKLFDPFYTTKNSGTGLGLAVSYGIINQHRGKIDVKSIPGQGSVFSLIFPVSC